MTYTHLAKTTSSIEPGFSDFLVGIVSEFDTIETPTAPFTNPGDEVRIQGDHVPATDKGFYRIYQIKKKHTGKGDPTGTFGAKTFANEYDVFIPGMDAVQLEWVKNIMNEEVITLHRGVDCGETKWIQLGDGCKPAEIDVNYTVGTFEPTGELGFFAKVKWTGIPKFYEGVVPYAPDAA